MKEDNTYRPGRSYVGVRNFWLCDAIQNNELTVAYCPTADMIANVHTKLLSHIKLKEFWRKLFVV